jgi:hypothetical protein
MKKALAVVLGLIRIGATELPTATARKKEGIRIGAYFWRRTFLRMSGQNS